MTILDFLEKVDVFKNMDDKQLKEIQGCSHIENFNRGDRLFVKGDESQHLWIVKNGQVDLRLDLSENSEIKNNPISFISTAQTFGWSCFAPPYKYRLSGYCSSRTCEVVKIEKNRLLELFEKDADIGYQVMSYLVEVVGTQFYQYQNEIAKRIGEGIMASW